MKFFTKQPKFYNFVSTWHIRSNTAQVASLIVEPASWTSWWPGLLAAQVSDVKDTIIGSHISATWRALAGYKIKLTITITGYEPMQLITFASKGDLVGNGSWTIKPDGQGETKMIILWNVSTTKTWMNVFAPILKPIFIYSHHHLMQKGEQGLNDYVNKKPTKR